MAVLVAILLLIVGMPALAGESLRIAIVGDTQFQTACEKPDTAIDGLTDAIDSIIANADDIDVVIFPGDLTEHIQTGRSVADCDCLSQDPGVEACSTLTSWFDLDGCDECNDDEAKICKGGTPGRYCEWTRARNTVNSLIGIVPVMWVPGNHDQGMTPSDQDIAPAQYDSVWQEYRTFFGDGTLDPNFKEYGSYTVPVMNYPRTVESVAAGLIPRGGEVSSYHVLEAAGSDWLIVGLGHVKLAIGQSEPTTYQLAAMESILEWAAGVIEDHPGLPTIIVAHWFWNETEEWAVSDFGGFYQMPDAALNKYPQVFLNIGGHFGNPGTGSQTGSGNKIAASGYKIIGMVHDFSYDLSVGSGLPAWVLEENGGGGVVGYVRVDPRAGLISQYAYSPAEAERVVISSGDGTNVADWREQIDMCGSPRWVLGDSTCADPPRPCNGCWSALK